jgi:hypothetical protein
MMISLSETVTPKSRAKFKKKRPQYSSPPVVEDREKKQRRLRPSIK